VDKNRVKVLPKRLANKIAAGEVVERPASVVKELVENAIDANATAIKVTIKGGGVAEISVYDNGNGMSKEDVRLSPVRFATSKLKDEKNLFQIGSLGFRGEALSSISAVAKVNVASAQKDGKGCFLECSGGTIERENDIVMDKGTVVKVRELFFNVPARRKFLKSKLSENRACWEIIRRYLVAYPNIGFDVNIDGKQIMKVVPEEQSERLKMVIKEPWVENAVFMAYPDYAKGFVGTSVTGTEERTNGNYSGIANEGGVSVAGYLMNVQDVGKGRPTQWLFVNRRPIEDSRTKFVVKEAYESIAKRGSPGFVLFVELPFDAVDVNVHPRKTEIKFKNADVVYKAIYQAVKKLFAKEKTDWGVLGDSEAVLREPTSQYGVPIMGQKLGHAADVTGKSVARNEQVKIAMAFSEQFIARSDSSASAINSKTTVEGEGKETIIDETRNGLTLSEEKWSIGGRVPIVQVKNAYLLTADSAGITVIDQHAAAERVLYEEVLSAISGTSEGSGKVNSKARERSKGGKALVGKGVPKQALLVPIDVDADTSLLGKTWAKQFQKLGIEADLFGENAIRIRALPVGVSPKTGKQLFIDLLNQDFAEEGSALADQKEKVAATIACHSAIKFGDRLSDIDIRKLVSKLSKCNNPFSCPHGRPTMYRIPYSKLESLFERG